MLLAQCTCIVDSHPQTSEQKTNPPRVTSSLRSDGGIHHLSISNYFQDIIGLFGKNQQRCSLLVWRMPPGKCNLQKFHGANHSNILLSDCKKPSPKARCHCFPSDKAVVALVQWMPSLVLSATSPQSSVNS